MVTRLFSSQVCRLGMFLADTGVSGLVVLVMYGHSFQILVTGWDLSICLVFRVALAFGLCLGSTDILFKVRSYVKGFWKDFISF